MKKEPSPDPVAAPPEAEKNAASTSFFGNIFGGPKADTQVEESASVAKDASDDDIELRDVALRPESCTVNTDSEQDEYQDTEVADFNAPEEKPSDSADEVRSTPIHTERQNTTVLVNIYMRETKSKMTLMKRMELQCLLLMLKLRSLRVSRRVQQMMTLSLVMLI
jgi:hypothetical protein